MTNVTKKTPLIALALVIFAEQLAVRSTGGFANNRDFRNSVITRMTTELNVTVASAATMYNSAKTASLKADPTLTIGRDPVKVKVAKVRTKKATIAATTVTPVEETTEAEQEAETA